MAEHAPPLSREAFAQLTPRTAQASNVGRVTKSLFVAGSDSIPAVNAEVVPIERIVDGQNAVHYEIRLNIEGIRLGERASPPPLRGEVLRERLSEEDVRRFEQLLTPFVPDHLAFDPEPLQLARAFPTVPLQMEARVKYYTTVFDPDERRVFRDTSYPWSAMGRCETNNGPFSGAMIGPRHLLTCNHGIDWTAPEGFAADWLTFTPSYFDGDAPFGSTYATHIYWVQQEDGDGFITGTEGQYDYVVLVLNDRIGERTGWLGTRRYTDDWDPLSVWWHTGYPQDLTKLQRPIFLRDLTLNGDDNQDDAHEEIYHQGDVFPGQSGGPMFGFWDGDVGPRAVAVQSWQNSDTNGASGGGDLVDLAIRARNDFP